MQAFAKVKVLKRYDITTVFTVAFLISEKGEVNDSSEM